MNFHGFSVPFSVWTCSKIRSNQVLSRKYIFFKNHEKLKKSLENHKKYNKKRSKNFKKCGKSFFSCSDRNNAWACIYATRRCGHQASSNRSLSEQWHTFVHWKRIASCWLLVHPTKRNTQCLHSCNLPVATYWSQLCSYIRSCSLPHTFQLRK